MRAVGVEHLEETVEVVLTVSRPLASVLRKEADACVCEHGAAILRGGHRRRPILVDVPRYVVEQRFKKGSKLGVGGSPLTTRVCFDGLLEVAGRNSELKVPK